MNLVEEPLFYVRFTSFLLHSYYSKNYPVGHKRKPGGNAHGPAARNRVEGATSKSADDEGNRMKTVLMSTTAVALVGAFAFPANAAE